MFLFKAKARKRLGNWKRIRKERLEMEKEKKSIQKKLMQRYDIPEIVNEMFYAYRGDEDCYSFVDENGNNINLSTGDIIPFRRRGDIVFFYEITKSKSKFGDYGISDYATFYDLKYHHSDKIPEKVVDPKKSLKIEWKRINDEKQHGHIQGIRIVRLEIEKKDGYCYRVKAEYVKDNFSNNSSLPSYYDHYLNIGEAKKDIQQKVRGLINKGITIRQFYIPHKIRRKNR